MFNHYLVIAWRMLSRNKVFSLINVFGLALGICACLVIWTITQYEFSFDRFHADKDRIYRINTSEQLTKSDPVRLVPAVLPPLAAAVKSEVPGVETVAPYHFLYDGVVSVPGSGSTHVSYECKPVVAGPEYFSIMKYEWLAGNEHTALQEPFKVVLSEKQSYKYFGKLPASEIVGKELVYNDSIRVTVSGIVKDWKENSDFAFTEFISLATAEHGYLQEVLKLDQTNWKGVPYSSRVLLKLAKDVNEKDVNAVIVKLFSKKWDKPSMSISLQPLTSVHFTEYGGETEIRTAHLPTLYVLMSVALFILLLAVINYVNLATAQSLSRDKEIGIRKVLGSSRSRIAVQFLLETFLMSLLAVMLATVFVNPVLHVFRSFIPEGVKFAPFALSTITFLAGISLAITLLAGLYPARFLSSYLPVLTLRGSGAKGSERWWFRKGLIVFQFSISLVFIIGTLVVGSQIHFMLSKDLGFKSDAVILLSTNESRDSLFRVKQVEESIRQVPGVAMVARENMPPMGLDRGIFTIRYKPLGDEFIPVAAIKADEHFIPLYGMKLLAGKNLSPSDTIKEVVINESLSKLLGFKTPEQALGQSIFIWDKFCPITGVVADFHQASFHESIKPLLITGLACTDIVVKLDTKGASAENTKAILARIEKQWKQFYPHTPFEFSFLDEELGRLYEKEQTTSWLMNIASGITIFISCIGLFGLTLFTMEKRTREIGIRKVMGASIPDIVVMLSKDFVVLIVIALLIASPIAWMLMHKWLQDFVYRISPGIGIYLVAGIAILFITLLTVSFQSVKAALVNPVKSLRNE
ncbi:MAG: ABC transporter permease [Chitinophagaceae bacterium]